MPMRGSVLTHGTPIPTFPLKGGRSDVCRLQAAHGVTRAFEALTESAPGFNAGGQLTCLCAVQGGTNAAERMDARERPPSRLCVEFYILLMVFEL